MYVYAIYRGVLYKGYIPLVGLLKTVSFSGVFPASVVPKDSEASSNIVDSCGTRLYRDGSSGCLNRGHCKIDRCVHDIVVHLQVYLSIQTL